MFTGVPFLGWVGLLAGMVSRWCADSEPRGFTFFCFSVPTEMFTGVILGAGGSALGVSGCVWCSRRDV